MPSAVCWLALSFFPNSSNSTGLGVFRRLEAAPMWDCTHLSRNADVFSCESVGKGGAEATGGWQAVSHHQDGRLAPLRRSCGFAAEIRGRLRRNSRRRFPGTLLGIDPSTT
jgi:hypothetical protein